MGAAVGVDGCRGGWFAVVLRPGRPTQAVHGATLKAVAAQIPDADGFGVDIPIGVREDGVRAADLAVRQALRARWQSVFLTPVRAALEAPTHAEASATARRLTGRGVSQQAYALAPKILEAEQWAAHVDAPVWEVHPELCFAEMLGEPAAAAKTTWAGMRERLAALERHGVTLDGFGEVGARARVDDVLDAAAAAWSAARLLRGEGRCLPDPPETDPDTGRPIAIWV